MYPNQNPWQEAIERQMDALSICNYLIQSDAPSHRELNSGWQVDKALLTGGVPYVWSKETMQAVMLAGASIPLDTEMRWSLPCAIAWWYFESPLPYQTIFNPEIGVRALSFGWLPVSENGKKTPFPAGTDFSEVERAIYQAAEQDFGMPCVCWCDHSALHKTWGTETMRFPIQPSQTWEWGREATLGEMLEETRKIHIRLYENKEGAYYNHPHIEIDKFMAATEGCARFVLAGLAWLQQKVLVTNSGQLERHARKRYAKAIRPLDTVRVISLRKREYLPPADAEFESETHRELSCRFNVDGHWRNQAYGPKMSQRRLTWIDPYMKGPDAAPFRISPRKVYRVDR